MDAHKLTIVILVVALLFSVATAYRVMQMSDGDFVAPQCDVSRCSQIPNLSQNGQVGFELVAPQGDTG